MRLLPFVALVLAVAFTALADTITLKNGQVINGTFLGGSAREIRVDLGDQVQTFAITDIARIDFGGAAPAAVSTAVPATTPSAPTPPAPVLGITLPAGTNFTIRMIDPVDSQTAQTGQTFAASLDTPVNDANGNTVIPRGADVIVKLVNSQQSGKITGHAELALALAQVRVSGQLVDVYTQTITQKSSDRGARSAETIGGGAVGGMILGGILGGGKGAAVGAAAGGAAGAGVEMTTHGQRVKVPAETRLNFVLNQAVRI